MLPCCAKSSVQAVPVRITAARGLCAMNGGSADGVEEAQRRGLFRGLSCGGEHTLLVDTAGRLLSAGACGLGWHGEQDDAMAPATLDRRARPCIVGHFFAAVAAVTHGGGAGGGELLLCSYSVDAPCLP